MTGKKTAGAHAAQIQPLIVILGQTGTGKSALAMELARRYNGEIIAADSRTVYKGMDIGTAKPTIEDQRVVRHHGLDVVEPGEKFSAYDFKQLALKAIDDITARGKLPFLVGGTGLYIDAVLYDFSFRPMPDPAMRAYMQGLSVDELQARVLAAGLPLPENSANPRHLARLLESGLVPTQPREVRPNTLILGLRAPHDVLGQRIEARVRAMIAAGLVDEIHRLYKSYGGTEALRATGYKAFAAYIEGKIDMAEAQAAFVRADMQFAKRQLTWFRRNKHIHWLHGLTATDRIAEAAGLIDNLLDSPPVCIKEV